MTSRVYTRRGDYKREFMGYQHSTSINSRETGYLSEEVYVSNGRIQTYI